ncbi:MAG: DUF1684 domain-containing protein [Candidatus Cyclobacteriaceae bacterium M3_2C_046]
MNSKRIIGFLVILTGVIIMVYSFQSGSDGTADFDEATYRKDIEEHRSKKDYYLKTDQDSPFQVDDQSYQGLNYYPVSLRYRIMADFIPAATPGKRSVSLTDGSSEQYAEIGKASFELEGIPQELLVLESSAQGQTYHFIPFYDPSNESETYPGGRYLEPELLKGDKILLDFNLAYNPYCAYVPDYACPLPPPENNLSVAVTAGEKSYEK